MAEKRNIKELDDGELLYLLDSKQNEFSTEELESELTARDYVKAWIKYPDYLEFLDSVD